MNEEPGNGAAIGIVPMADGLQLLVLRGGKNLLQLRRVAQLQRVAQ